MTDSDPRGRRTSVRLAFRRLAPLPLALLVSVTQTSVLRAQSDDSGGTYHDDASLSESLRDLQRRHEDLVQLLELARTPGGRAVQAVRLGSGPGAEDRPALLVVAGAYGPHLIGTEVALHTARQLAVRYGSDTTVTRLLDRSTIYLVPRLNPDAASGYFAQPRRERVRNSSPYDDDRDSEVDEDGPEDLDGNGVITMMRVLDPAGDWLADPEEPALMRKADPSRGESGTYRLYTEGTDNDGDELWNEDPPGGTDINRNLPYEYQFFAEGAGLYPVSASESRGLAQFFLDHPNIAVVYVLGPQDNLVAAWKHERPSGSVEVEEEEQRNRRPLSSILEEDEPYFEEVAGRFKEITGLVAGPRSPASGGDVLSFGYYDMGRWSFGSRAWWIPVYEAENGHGADEAAPRGEDTSQDEEDPLEDERREFRWLRDNVPGSFVEWTEIRHPDFPDRTVETGGFAPFVRYNPPASQVDSVLLRHERFIMALAGLLPAVSVRDVRVEALAGGAYRVRVRIANEAYLPTQSALGERARWPRRVRVEIATDGQQIAAGRAIQLLGPLPGSGQGVELEWVLVGEAGSRITIRASSPVSGESTQTVTLR